MSAPAFKLPILPPAPRRIPPNHPKRAFMELGARCEECPLQKHRPVRTEWIGTGVPPITLVGEMPGIAEVRHGRPFVGASGRVLNYALQQAGVPRGQLAVLNCVACGPVPSGADAVKEAAMRACRPRLIAELRALRPKGVVAVGAYAHRALTPPNIPGVSALRGALLPPSADLPTDSWSPFVFSTFHPAHIMRGGDGEDAQEGRESSIDVLYYFLLFDLRKAWHFALGEATEWRVDADLFVDHEGRLHRALVDGEGAPSIGPPATVAELYDALGRVYEEARKHGELACDVETDSKDSLEASLTAIAYATIEGGVSATWNCWKSSDRVMALLREVHAARLRWIWQNGIYDRIVFRQHGLSVLGNHEDTLLMHHAAFPGLPHSLDQIMAQFSVTRPWKAEFRRSERNLHELVWYNLNDAVATARLGPAIRKHIARHKTERVYEADRQQNVIATHMRAWGCYVDRAEQDRHRAAQTARLDYMRTALSQEFGALEEPWRQALARLMADKQRKADPDSYLARVEMRYREIAERKVGDMNVGLLKTKAKLDIVALFNVLRIPVKAYTKTGLPVTDKKAMDEAAATHPFMRKLIHVRSAKHLIANYVDLPVKRDGRMHPDWKTNKITGRWGAGRSQNVPNNVPGWPPAKNDDSSFKIDRHGDYRCPKDNLRSIISAPTPAQILEVAARDASLVHPFVLARAKQGKGRMLVIADEDQVELRIVGFLSREPFLLNIFNNGLDPHAEFARIIFPRSFPQLETQIKDAGYKPKAVAKVIEEIIDLALPFGLVRPEEIEEPHIEQATRLILDRGHDIAKARLERLRELRQAMLQWKLLRDLSKRIEYGGLYKGSAPTLWESVVKDFPDLTLTDVERMLAVIQEAMPNVVRWWAECSNYARQNRETRERQLGRVRFFPLGNFSEQIAVNFPVQSYNSGLMAKALFRFTALTQPELLEFEPLYRMGLLDAQWVRERRARFGLWRAPVVPILQVHDSYVVECDEDDAEAAATLLTEALDQEDVDASGVRIRYTGEAHICRRWSRG